MRRMPGGPTMTKLLDILREEHRNIETLLRVLERQLDIFDRAERPDYEVVQAVIDYFEDYPDCCHHPKEDVIFAKLKARDPEAAAAVGDLAAEHRSGAERLHKVVRAVGGVLNERELPRKAVDETVREFIEKERHHMQMEERVLFPAAATALLPWDWAEIETKLRNDPSLGAARDRFNALRRSILEWERENAADSLTEH
jgi:hemerythrin-like domain-containing protein